MVGVKEESCTGSDQECTGQAALANRFNAAPMLFSVTLRRCDEKREFSSKLRVGLPCPELLWLYLRLRLVNARDHLFHALEFSGLVTVVLLRQPVGFCFDGFFAIVGIGVIRQEL